MYRLKTQDSRLKTLSVLCFMSCVFLCSVSSVCGSPFTAFFFDANAFSVDEDGDGGDDHILVQFDVDLDEDITSIVTVIATLYDQADNIVATDQISYQVTDQEAGYAGFSLVPSPNIEGTYYVHIALSDLSDELYIDDIYYNPELGSAPIAYFADAVASSEMDGIEVELDVDIVQQIACDVTIVAELIDSAGAVVASQTLNYGTFFEDIDYQRLSFTLPGEDAYSVVLMVYPAGNGVATDSRLLQVLWPPGTGAYFSRYEAFASHGHIEVTFEVDLAYSIIYTVSVEAILYDSSSDVVGYSYISYLTNGSSEDERSVSLVPEQISADTYYVELIVYVEGYPASYGYIEEVPYGESRWDINRDSIVDSLDLLILCTSFGRKTSELENPNADIDGDGVVDTRDFVILAIHYGSQ